LKTDVNSQSKKQKNFVFENLSFVGISEVTDKKSRIQVSGSISKKSHGSGTTLVAGARPGGTQSQQPAHQEAQQGLQRGDERSARGNRLSGAAVVWRF
jgi:hypothetical protein